MDLVGNLFIDYVKKWFQVFFLLFVYNVEFLIVNQFRGVYVVVWDEEGFNKRVEEEDSIYCFDQFLMKVII